MNPTRDKFIVEWFKECWHEEEFTFGKFDESGNLYTWKCKKCENRFNINRNLSTPDGFFWLWGKMSKRKDFPEFIEWCLKKCNPTSFTPQSEFLFWLINPDHFADAVYEFLKKELQSICGRAQNDKEKER